MKVVFCDYASPRLMTGPGSWLRRLLPLLRERGVESRVLFIRRASGNCPAIDELSADGFSCADVLHIGYTEERIRWILEQLALDPPDVFVPNVVIPAYYAGQWAREAGIATVGVLHSDSDYYHSIEELFVRGEPAFRLSGVVAVSQALEADLLRDRPVDVRVKRIPYGVPVPAGRAEPPGDTMRLVYLGRLEEEQKQISATTRALCRAVRETPGVEATIYGDGSARPAVERIIAEAGDIPLRYAGRIPNAEVLDELRRHHVFVLLSDYEGVPVALMEAMAAGLVPICMDIRSGIPELVHHEETGMLVADRGDAFVAAVGCLRESAELWLRLSGNARVRVEAGYSLTAGADAWVEMLQELAGQDGPPRAPHIPRHIDLPPPHPVLARLDHRRPPMSQRFSKEFYRQAGRIRRRVLRE
jgi:glycosyltransferase involved in cell wall biosynthesis